MNRLLFAILLCISIHFHQCQCGIKNCHELVNRHGIESTTQLLNIDRRRLVLQNEKGESTQINIDIDGSSTYETQSQQRSLLESKCRPLSRQESISASLFSTIAALIIMDRNQNHFGYKFDFSISDGTLIAQQRDVLIFPWDSDSDMYILFDENHNATMLEKFRQDLVNVLTYISKLKNASTPESKPELPAAVKLSDVTYDYESIANGSSDIVYSEQRVQNKAGLWWSRLYNVSFSCG